MLSSGSGENPAAKRFLVHFHIKMKSLATRIFDYISRFHPSLPPSHLSRPTSTYISPHHRQKASQLRLGSLGVSSMAAKRPYAQRAWRLDDRLNFYRVRAEPGHRTFRVAF